MSSQKSKIHTLVVVAHPDDEALFFGGLILTKPRKCTVVCVTDGNADGKGTARRLQFEKACRQLGVASSQIWEFPDVFEKRLDVLALEKKLAELPLPKEVFTHGITGEYGHPHHQDVSLAVHRRFHKRSPVWSSAYNIYPQKKIQLTQAQFDKRAKIVWDNYRDEVSRFLNFVPVRAQEGFCQIPLAEVEAIYAYLSNPQQPIPSGKLGKYKWLKAYLEMLPEATKVRPF